MKKNIYWSFLFCFVFLYSCKDGEMQQTAQMGPLSLPVVEIPSRTVTGYTEYPVSIEGTVNAAVRAKIPGYITEVLVDAGQEVREGQTLFRLETSSLSQEASAAQANVNAAQVEVDKLKPLVEKGIISPVQLETAKARLEQAQAAARQRARSASCRRSAADHSSMSRATRSMCARRFGFTTAHSGSSPRAAAAMLALMTLRRIPHYR